MGVIDKGGLKNFQTEGDRAVQRLICTTLRAKFPDIAIIGEEDDDRNRYITIISYIMTHNITFYCALRCRAELFDFRYFTGFSPEIIGVSALTF